ncbi:MAG: hypothetical protein JWM74_1193 [Myxococcaceae bacterium]|nr:hypothetical protein [Myxococcaceae bacterium]
MRARKTRFSSIAALGVGIFALALASPARAEGGLSSDEMGQLSRGETVVRAQDMEAQGRRYVGGVTYTVLEASAEELMAVLDDPHAFTEFLPKTKFAERVAAHGRDSLMELHQGNALVDAAYTLYIRKEPERGRVRFWLDLSRPHAIDDAWGFFRYQALDATTQAPRTLMVYGALVDLGPGIIRELYEERLRRVMLAVPQLVRQYIARSAAGRRPRVAAPEGR